jgi:hypothetical protein
VKRASLLCKTAETNYILPRGSFYVTNYQLVFKSRPLSHMLKDDDDELLSFPTKEKGANEVLFIATEIYVGIHSWCD